MQKTDDRLMTVKEVAFYGHVSEATVVRAIHAGRLKAINSSLGKVNKRWRIKPSEVSKWLATEEA